MRKINADAQFRLRFAEKELGKTYDSLAETKKALKLTNDKLADSEKARKLTDAKLTNSEKAREQLAAKFADSEKERKRMDSRLADSEKKIADSAQNAQVLSLAWLAVGVVVGAALVLLVLAIRVRMKGPIFISYRRGPYTDSAARLAEHLVAAFGKRKVFIDTDGIPSADNFEAVIGKALDRSSIFLAVISPDWVGRRAGKPEDKGRLSEEADHVRLECETALSLQIPIIPVLVGGAEMPRPDELPSSLTELTKRNAIPVGQGIHYRAALERLKQRIRQLWRSWGRFGGKAHSRPRDGDPQVRASEAIIKYEKRHEPAGPSAKLNA
jgi:hypothetical protein